MRTVACALPLTIALVLSAGCAGPEDRCGDGVVDDGEECDDGNYLLGDGCDSRGCVVEFCGDGIQQIRMGEECDDGNTNDDDGCKNDCLEPEPGSVLCGAGGTSVLDNPFFESGSLAPWTGPGTIITTNVHAGTYSVELLGNVQIHQTFDPVPVASIVTARFWSWVNVEESISAGYARWEYTDGTYDSVRPRVWINQSGWRLIDFRDKMDESKSIDELMLSGHGLGPTITRVDTVELCAE